MLDSGAKANAEEVEEDPQEGHVLDSEDGGGLSVFQTYPASDTIFLPDGNSSRVSSVHLTITVLYRLRFLMSDRGFRRANRRLKTRSLAPLVYEKKSPGGPERRTGRDCKGGPEYRVCDYTMDSGPRWSYTPRIASLD